MIERVIAAFIYLIAGTFTYFVVLNRLILPLHQGLRKATISYTIMFVLTGPLFLLGFFRGIDALTLLPVLILLLFLIGEIKRNFWRSRHRMEDADIINSRSFSDRSFWTTDHLAVRRYRISIPGVKSVRIRFVHLSDFHMDQRLPGEYFKACFEQANRLEPDFILLTGDFTDKPEILAKHLHMLKALQSQYGLFAVLGNHDYYAGADNIRKMLIQCDIELLNEECRMISIQDGYKIYLCGTEKPWSGHPLPQKIKSEGQLLTVFLSHTPDNIFGLAKAGADLVFSGHLHGGQWRFPVIGPLVIPSRHGRLFDYGHYIIRRTHLFITSGIGMVWIPYRIKCNPEITVVDVSGL